MQETFFRLAASGLVPRMFFAPELPTMPPPPPAGRPLELEIVSHCWRYSHLLIYQLSSLVLYPPEETSVTMTVFFSREDPATVALLDFFGHRRVPRVRWNWQALEKTRLFRRALGRNLAARRTRADWIWFADCDLVFRAGAMDSAGRVLASRDDRLVFPRRHLITELLDPEDPILVGGRGAPRVLDIGTDAERTYTPDVREKAVGALQIVRGDVARAGGYCGTIPFYQRPVPRWRRTHEDRVFRWLLGTHGTPVDIEGIFRIRHQRKGRKGEDPASS